MNAPEQTARELAEKALLFAEDALAALNGPRIWFEESENELTKRLIPIISPLHSRIERMERLLEDAKTKADKFIVKCNAGKAGSVETYQDMMALSNSITAALEGKEKG